MTREEFERLLREDTYLAKPVKRAAMAGQEVSRYAGPLELAAIALMFPVVSFIITKIGLPWLGEAARYSELWRQKFHKWIDEEYKKHGFDPDKAEAAGEAFRRELEAMTDEQARKAWERFADLLKKSEDADSDGD